MEGVVAARIWPSEPRSATDEPGLLWIGFCCACSSPCLRKWILPFAYRYGGFNMGMEHRRLTGEYLPLRDAMERLFEGSVITPQVFGAQSTFPPVDLFVTDDDVIVELAVPGAKQDELSISVTGETVTISGEVRREAHEEKGHAYAQEIFQGKFQRAFKLPIQIDAEKARATFENGILTLHLPKAEATKPHKIQIEQRHGGSNTDRSTIEGHVQKETVAAKTS